MAKILITGMSGTGKSSALRAPASHGHRTVDTDSDRWSHWTTDPNGSSDRVWRERAMTDLLAGHGGGDLLVAGCKSDQGAFYPLFDHVVLLSAPADVLLARVAARTGKRPEERAEILANLAAVEPLLRATATAEVDASAPLDQVVRQLEDLATDPSSKDSKGRDRLPVNGNPPNAR